MKNEDWKDNVLSAVVYYSIMLGIAGLGVCFLLWSWKKVFDLLFGV